MYFKVYHKKSGQLLQTFNEKSIVDFCTRNKENLSTFYFSTGNKKNVMEWEVFATNYSYLFEEKGKEHQIVAETEAADEDIISGEPERKRNIPWIPLLSLVIVIVVFILFRAGILFREEHAQPMSPQSAKKQVRTMAKRTPTKADTMFTASVPSQKELEKIWKKQGMPKVNALTPLMIKKVMDTMLPDLKRCFDERVDAGDGGLRGTLNLKVRVSGDGVVRDVLLPDEKYRASLFGDCVISSLKQKKFPTFRAQEQVFTYYFSL